jgi:hypothetical protein
MRKLTYLLTNLTAVEVARADTASVKLTNAITTLTIGLSTQFTGTSNLSTLKLTGNATSIPTWATNGSLTAVNATLDLSAMTGLF